jgi:DNA-directed RNA polymerase subunit beta
MDGEEILERSSTTDASICARTPKDGWTTPFNARAAWRGVKAGVQTSIDADIRRGRRRRPARKHHPRAAAKLAEDRADRTLLIPTDEACTAGIAGQDLVNAEHRRNLRRSRRRSSTEALDQLLDADGVDALEVLDIDHVNTGPYIRNTLNVDKNADREEALIDIYRVMRPGEPPTLETGRSAVPRPVLRRRSATTCRRSAA